MGRNIRVTGKGKLSVKPDTICLTIEVQEVFPDYEKTIKESADRTKEVTEDLTFHRQLILQPLYLYFHQ